MTTEEKQFGPRIVLAYQNYKPPFDSEKAIRKMLAVIPANYLWGLHSIVLTNVQALSRKSREQKGAGRRRVPTKETLGYYSRPWKGEPARVTLLIDNVEKHWGRNWLRFPLLRDAQLSELLFHEIGHHIHCLHIPQYEGQENVAEKWSKKFRRKYIRKHYWYLIPAFYIFARIFRWFEPKGKSARIRTNS